MKTRDNLVGVILAAGKGMRLRPATELCPKPLIPVAGVEPLFFAIEKFYNCGINQIVVNTHYLHEQISESLNNWKNIFPDIEIRISHEEQILGTGGSLHKIIHENKDWFQNSGLIVQNGDTVSSIDISRLLSNPQSNTFSVSKSEIHLKKYNPLWLNKSGNWVGIGVTAKDSNWIPAHYLGTHYLSPDSIEEIKKFIAPETANDLFNAVYRPLSDKGILFQAVEFFSSPENKDEFWFDMTSQEYFLEAQKHILNNNLQSYWAAVLEKRYPGIKKLASNVFVSSDVGLAADQVQGPCVIITKSQSKVLKLFRTVGPSFCWIEKEDIDPNGWTPTELKDSTVYIHRKTTLTKDTLSKQIQNQVVVL